MNGSRTFVLVCFLTGWLLASGTSRATDPATAAPPEDTLWVIPHTHWEGAVFKTREEYLQIGLPHILHALQLLKEHPTYTFVLDQVAYVKPFLERYPEHEALFRKFIAEGRLQLVLGMDVMPDVSKPGGETLIRQIQYGKGYYRQKLGVDVTACWLVDTFGHPAQMPQILKLGGYKSFWFFRGVPDRNHPSEFLWEGIDGTRMPSFWLPEGYGLFFGAPDTLPAFEKFAKERFVTLNPNAHGHDRVAPAGVDVSDPEEQLPRMMEKEQASGHNLGFKLRFGVPSQFEAAVAKRTDLPVFKGDLDPIFQGTYSSRIELKQWMRRMERLLTTAEKLGVIGEWLGAPPDNDKLWSAWEPVLFNETHDLASGVMTDHVYEDVMRGFEFSRRLADEMIDARWDRIAAAIDTRGEGTPVVVFNTLGWLRTDVTEAVVAFTERGVKGVAITDPAGAEVPVQILETIAYPDGGIRQARVAFAARDVPALGYAVYHAVPRSTADAVLAADKSGDAILQNDFYRLSFDRSTGAITSLQVKPDNWDAISGPANVISRQEDKGDLWELYQGLDGGSRIAMTRKQAVPQPSATTKLSVDFKAEPGTVHSGPVFSEFTVSHPFDDGSFATTVRLAAGLRRIDITTRLVNNHKFVRYQALFPTSIHDGRSVHGIAFGAIDRPEGIEFPAQDWVDYSDGQKGLALLNVGLPGNLVSDGTMMLSLLRAHTLGAYGFGGGYEPGMSSDSGFGLGQGRQLHYALMPHRGDWRDAGVYREGMEFGYPLVTRKEAPHAGRLPARWGFLTVSQPNVVVSALQPGKDGAMALRVYEATGKPARQVKLTFAAPVLAASETNLMEDPGAELKPDGSTLTLDLGAFQIKNLSLRLARPPTAEAKRS
jgi:alpha-mannosidase